MKNTKGWIVGLGILALALGLAGCAGTEGTASDWEDEAGERETAIAGVRNLALANAEEIERVLQQIEALDSNSSSETASVGSPAEIQQLSNQLAVLQQTLGEIDARVSALEATISQLPQRPAGAPEGRP